ncbi:response regulator receiver domain-containing protein [Halohasta litchfieldiae]|jgi:DNA-binding response OmpR family regulator|uniref:Response regulator receiver domain-containing protein n=1 Tax=Halohasta litchfieldiae TaxID=1073996 RepID=A0A1H6R7J8_9EURY|nr:HalX domain-containing protein [Halohasta litchfieldiae]ATW88570.1 response regulator receiver domain-containing protein [Halohasta litchfieldiae]SEI48507.1 Response regulator receiver domain-containing protein [Halohasta litchfieldiae]
MSAQTILVVEDDSSVTKLYVQFLKPEYTVFTAETAQEGIDILLGNSDADTDAAGIDAVLLDRRLPDAPGEEVLNLIEDRGFDCRVAMVTGVEPDFDIVDMGFDLYIVKPVTRSELLEAVETLFVRSEYGGLLREAASLASKRALLESEKSDGELDASEEYGTLLGRMSELDDELLDLAGSLSSDDYRVMFRDLGNA